MVKSVVYHMSHAYQLGYKDGIKDAIETACKTYCRVCFNQQAGCEELCNDIKVFKQAVEETDEKAKFKT